MPLIQSASLLSRHNTWLEINRDQILQNLRTLREAAGYPPHIMAVIKANAYGHGLGPVAEKIAPEVDYLGVSSLQDALELKEHRIQTPVFIFGRLFGEEMKAALMENITLSVSSFDECLEIHHAATVLNRKVPVHVKIDTGMGRMGIPLRNAEVAIEKMKHLEHIELEGIYTHFPTAAKDDGFRDVQVFDFASLIQSLYEKGITFRFRHAANSAGMVKSSHPALNLCRPGLMLYGLYPDPSFKKMLNIQPALTWKSRIILVKTLKRGESAGYGREFTAEQSTNIAIVPVGYSHGYPFRASHRAHVLYRGKRIPLAGRVSMDYLILNLGGMIAKPGDEVTLIGEELGERISAEELAEWTGTIPYEIVTRLIPSLPRIFP